MGLSGGAVVRRSVGSVGCEVAVEMSLECVGPRALLPYARAQSDVCATRVRGMWRLEVWWPIRGGRLRVTTVRGRNGAGRRVVRVGGRGCGPDVGR